MNEATQAPSGCAPELLAKCPDGVISSTEIGSHRPAANYWLAPELLSLLRLVRVDKPLASALFTLGGVYLGGGWGEVGSFAALRAALAMSFIVASSFALNDVQDTVADQTNKPNRPIASGLISRRFGILISSVLAAAGIAIASTLEVKLAAFTVVLVALSIFYSYRLKGTPLLGNGLIGLMIASILVYGALVTGNVTRGVWEGCILTFLFTFSNEILFTIRDVEADRNACKHTVSVKFGAAWAFRFFQLTALLLVCSGVLMWALGLASHAFVLTALGCSFLPVILILADTFDGSPQSVQTATVWMRRLSLLSPITVLLLR